MLLTVTAELGLRDLHLPAAISWWPPASGWWLLLGISILLCYGIGIWLQRRWRRQRARRAAQRALQQYCQEFAENRDAQQLIQRLSILLKRVALSYFPRSEVASLHGHAWLQFLDRAFDGSPQAHAFTRGVGRVLATAPYRPKPQIDGDALCQLCALWLQASWRAK